MKASFIHGKPNVEQLERDARQILGLPALPDGANGPRSRALLAQIQADEQSMGKAAALRKWARVSTVAHACALDADPAEHRAASGRSIADLEHPTRKGEYHYPHSEQLEKALQNPTARAKCSAQALARLDSHRANAGPLTEDWIPPGLS